MKSHIFYRSAFVELSSEIQGRKTFNVDDSYDEPTIGRVHSTSILWFVCNFHRFLPALLIKFDSDFSLC